MKNGVSEINEGTFFLAKEGKTNAKAELEATITSFYNEVHFDDNSSACLFPARLHWLKKKLDLKGLPRVDCDQFTGFLEKTDPDSMSLIFPFSQGSAPSSMFGHTFLRLDSRSKPPLISYAFNYGSKGEDDEDMALIYIYKGLLGGYDGGYSLRPYYEKIKEYRDIEERDVWEYKLNFTKEETFQSIRHMWEVEFYESPYYFFTNNCSYKMFWVLQAGREGLDLGRYFNFHVIPLETIRACEDEGLIKSSNYRPSRGTKLLAYEKRLSDNAISQVLSLHAKKLSPKEYIQLLSAPKQEQRFVLEATSELYEYDYLKKDINQTQYKKDIYEILLSRAGLGAGESIKIDEPVNPLLSHRAFKLTAQMGIRNSEAIGFVGLRPANHHMNDSELGLVAGTQVEFMDVLFSHTKDEMNLEHARVVSVAAFNKRGKFFQPDSWRFGFGWDRNYLSTSTKFTANYSQGYSFFSEYGYIYVLADALVYNDKALTLGASAIVGMSLYENKGFKTNFEVSQRYYDTGFGQRLLSLNEHYASSQNTAVSLSYEYVEKYEGHWDTIKFSFDYFF